MPAETDATEPSATAAATTADGQDTELEAAIAFLRANGCSETLSVLEREYQPQPQPQPEQPALQPSAPPPDHPSQAVPPLEQS